MSSYTLKLNVNQFNDDVEQAFKDTAFLLGREFTRVITQPRNWDGFEGPRDIVDRGQLRSSQQLIFTGPLEALYTWPVEYAEPVHDGYTLRDGRRIKGRPWTQVAISEFDVQKAFEGRLGI